MNFIIMRSLSIIFTSSCPRFKLDLLYNASGTSFSTKYYISHTNRSLSVCMHLLLSQNTAFICFFANLIYVEVNTQHIISIMLSCNVFRLEGVIIRLR